MVTLHKSYTCVKCGADFRKGQPHTWYANPIESSKYTEPFGTCAPVCRKDLNAK